MPKKIFLRGRIARLPATPEDQKPAGNPVNRMPPGRPARPDCAVLSGSPFVLRFRARVSARERRRWSRATPATSKDLGKHPEIWTVRARQVSLRAIRPSRSRIRPLPGAIRRAVFGTARGNRVALLHLP